MVYTGGINGKYLLLALIVVAGLLGYLGYAGKIGDFFSGRMFLGQVITTPLQQTEIDYLKNLNGLASLSGVSTEEDLQQKFIETLLIHSQEFDKTSATAAERYLKDYYKITGTNVPDKVTESIKISAQKFLQAAALTPTQFNITPFINEVLSILANHQVSTNNYQAVQRAQTTRSLLDALIKQL